MRQGISIFNLILLTIWHKIRNITQVTTQASHSKGGRVRTQVLYRSTTPHSLIRVSALYEHDRPFLDLHFQQLQVANCFCDSQDTLIALCHRSSDWFGHAAISFGIVESVDIPVSSVSRNFKQDTAHDATAP